MEEIKLLVHFVGLMGDPLVMIGGIVAAIVMGGLLCVGLALKIADTDW